MKTCKKCGEKKPLDAFYKHPKMADGHDSKCKECAKAAITAARERNIDKVREYDRQRAKLPHRMELNKQNVKRYRQENSKRYRANNRLNNAIRDGKISKLPCWICGSLDVEGHHPDYDAPLSVVWLCAAHHKEIHLKHPR